MAIDKSIRQYQQLVKPGKGRPGYQGEEEKKDSILDRTKRILGWGIAEDARQKILKKREAQQKAIEKLFEENQGGGGGGGGGGKEKKLKLVEMGEKLTSPKTELVSRQPPDALKTIMNQLAQGYLGKRTMGLGVPAIRSVKDLWTGKKSFRDIPGEYISGLTSGLTQGSLWDRAKAGYQTLAPIKNILGSEKGIMSKILSGAGKAAPLLGAGAGIAYLHRNRERFTGYPTQIAYEQARQGRINIDRIDMRSDPKTLENLEINLKREGLSDKEIKDRINQFKGDTVRLKADVVGADIFNPNEMKNLDDSFENIKYNIDLTDKGAEPSFAGEDYDVTPSDINVIKQDIGMPEHLTYTPPPEPVSTGGGGGGPPSITSRPSAPAPSAPTGTGGPPSQGGGGGGPPSRGGGSPSRGGGSPSRGGGNPWGRAYGGRIDKPLRGRNRDI